MTTPSHMVVVDDDVEEMITLFHVCGTLLYMDENGKTVGYDVVHTGSIAARISDGGVRRAGSYT